MIFIVFGGQRSAFVEEHFHPHGGKEGPPTMIVPVAILALLSIVGGFVQFAPAWHPLTDWLSGAATPAERCRPRGGGSRRSAPSSSASPGWRVAWAIYVAKKRAAPKPWTVLENLFYFDKAYDLVFYRSAVFLATFLRRYVEEPVVIGGSDRVGERTVEAGRESTVIQTGLLRTYVLGLTLGVPVIVLVFLAVR